MSEGLNTLTQRSADNRVPADSDITEALATITEQIEMAHALDDHEHKGELRKVEVVMRRLSREAGYILPDQQA
ncbi:hypothetical protein GCM10007094_23130 [Pseudovibrio japonicus]|uniref:Uncharacterized protein n=1 Tax=Pseudovibrio japonicus TaxID=366534 RepID=A0ABQ3ECI5_9HYPH|nr:hypothetical protein [Pseudovibrio japonicus]GHB33699.1 hypothetical protein GCM10007094_23130 [Pseudovibrio japonicus]